MSLAPGTRLGFYEVLDLVGAGGMGEVYRARDTKLGRDVAIKVLPEAFAQDDERLVRFEREARILALLNHPNIAAIYGLERSDAQRFLVLEYVPGETLRGRIRRGPVSIDETLTIFRQIAEGLGAAHAQGVIHRDLKPDNLKITEHGTVKILDFGLAKAFESGPTSGSASASSPTLVREASPDYLVQQTRPGVILGTAAYMSPEQVRGQPVDRRSDIWSFGCVFYETLTGRLAFPGDTASDNIVRILEREADWQALPRATPPSVRRLLHRCLQKNQAKRLHDIADARIEIDDSSAETSAPRELSWERPRVQRVNVPRPVAVAALIVSILSFSAAVYFATRGEPPSNRNSTGIQLTQLSNGTGLSADPSWSPDGKWIAFSSNSSGNGTMEIWKSSLDVGQPSQLTDTPYNETQPVWSPDGRMLAFCSDRDGGGIFLLPADGGNAWRLTEFGVHPRWSPSGRTLAFEWQGSIYLVPETGGQPERLVSGGTTGRPHANWGPNGKRLIFWNRLAADIQIISIGDRSATSLNLLPAGEEVSGLAWSHDGRELIVSRGPYGGNKNLWTVPLDPETGKAIGEAVPLLVSVTDDIQCSFSPDDSRLAFTARQLERHLWAFPLDSRTGLTTSEPVQITTTGRQNYYPVLSPDGGRLLWTSHHGDKGLLYSAQLGGKEKSRGRKVTAEWGRTTREIGGGFSPDGRQISYTSTLGGSYQIWRMPSLGSVALQLTETSHPIRDVFPAWSPDGQTLAMFSNRLGNWDIWTAPADGRAEPKPLTQWESVEMYPAWSPDAEYVAFQSDKEGSPDIWLADSEGEDPRPFVVHPAEEVWSAWSRDGRWFYFTSNRSNVFEVWVRPAGDGEARQVTFYKDPAFGLPESALFTKFAVSDSELIVPLESRRGDVYLLERGQ